jgi:hypothetical protein
MPIFNEFFRAVSGSFVVVFEHFNDKFNRLGWATKGDPLGVALAELAGFGQSHGSALPNDARPLQAGRLDSSGTIPVGKEYQSPPEGSSP